MEKKAARKCTKENIHKERAEEMLFHIEHENKILEKLMKKRKLYIRNQEKLQYLKFISNIIECQSILL
jgi:hypothetical protein